MSVSQAVLPSFFITLASFPILNLIAKKWGIVDKPGGRKIHDKETPLTGGIAIGIGLISMYFFSPFVFYCGDPRQFFHLKNVPVDSHDLQYHFHV